MAQALTLPSIFKAVSKTLSENEAVLNEADTYNHNHGSNMAKAFTTVSKAVAKKKDLPVSDQLAYASEVLKDSSSGSARFYAQGLANASQKFQGKQLNENTVGLLINVLMGTQEPAQETSGAADQSLLGSLLGGMTGAQTQQQSQPSGGDLLGSLLGGMTGSSQQQSQPSGGDLLGSLLGGMTGSSQQQSQPSGGDNSLDVTDLLSAGLAYYSAKQQGGSTMEAIMQALSSASPLGKREDQTQSGALVINTILNMLKKKK
jgi:hypothetical protein